MFPGCMVFCCKEPARRRPAATRISEVKKTEMMWVGVADPRAAEGRRDLEQESEASTALRGSHLQASALPEMSDFFAVSSSSWQVARAR